MRRYGGNVCELEVRRYGGNVDVIKVGNCVILERDNVFRERR